MTDEGRVRVALWGATGRSHADTAKAGCRARWSKTVGRASIKEGRGRRAGMNERISIRR